MPEKSKVKTWFNGLAREVLTGEDLTMRRSSVTTGNTVATFQGYPSLPSDNSESEGDGRTLSPSDRWHGRDKAAVPDATSSTGRD